MKEDIKLITKRLKDAGFKSYVVGGAVRDKKMGREPKDYDIASNAKSSDIKKIFKDFNVLEIGEAFGITAVIINGTPYEIAQFRKDGESSDGRRPDNIEIVDNIESDLGRRDFTMNAMAWDPDSDEFTDPYEGGVDIENKRIKFVGNPWDRIVEDRLRIFRAFRFMSQLGFVIEEKSLSAIKKFMEVSADFAGVSQERITAEFSKILEGQNSFNTIKSMFDIGIMELIIPETEDLKQPHNNKYHKESMEPYGASILSHVLYVIKFASQMQSSNKLILMLAALLHDIGKPKCRGEKPDGTNNFHTHDIVGAKMAEDILIRMKFPSNIISRVVRLIKMHMNFHEFTKIKKVYKLRRLLGISDFDLQRQLAYCDTAATSSTGEVPNIKEAEEAEKLLDELISQHGQELPKPIISGEDLISAGMKPGPDFKKRLEGAFNYQLNGETNKQKLINYAKGLLI